MNGWTKAFGIIEMIAAVIFTVAVVLAKLDGMSIATISLDDFFANDTYKLLTIAAGGLAAIGGLGSIVAGSKARSAFNCILGALIALMGAVYLMAAVGEIDWMQSNVDLFLTVLFAITAIMAIAFTVSRRRYVGIVVFILLFLLIVVLKGRDFDGEIVDVLGHGFPLYAFAADMFMPIVGAVLLFFVGLFVTLYAIKESRAVVVVEASEEEVIEVSEEPAPAVATEADSADEEKPAEELAAAAEPVSAVVAETPAAVAEEKPAEEPAAAAVPEEKPVEESAPAAVEEPATAEGPAEEPAAVAEEPAAAAVPEEKPAEDIPAMPKVMSSQAAAATAAAAKAEQEERLSEESADEEKPVEESAAVEETAEYVPAVATEEDGENPPEEESAAESEDEESSYDDLGLEPDTPETFVRRAAWNKGLRCRRDYGKYKIPVAFVKGKVAVFVDDGVPSSSKDEVLVKEGWTVLHFAEADVTDGSIEADIIAKAVKENTKTTKKKRKTTKR